MAFEGLKLTQDIPKDVKGVYFFPYTWFRYGLENSHLEIRDLRKFANSLQGSVISYFEEVVAEWSDNDQIKINRNFQWYKNSDNCFDLWLLFTPGQSIVKFITIDWEGPSVQILSPSSKTGFITICGLQTLLDLGANEQRNINNTIITTFSGCGVKMIDSVWNMDNIFTFN